MSDDVQEYNPGHQIEGLDRCHLILCLLDDHLAEHPAILKAGAGEHVATAAANIFQAYQLISQLDEEEG